MRRVEEKSRNFYPESDKRLLKKNKKQNTTSQKFKTSKCSFKAADSWLKLRPAVATKSWLS